MKRYIKLWISVIIMLLTADLSAQSRRNVQDINLFKSSNSSKSSPRRIFLPSNIENYISIKLASLGAGLSGIVSDAVSDYFRNPAYINLVETRAYYLDIDRQGSSNDLRVSMFSSLLNGRFGLSFSGDAAKTITTDNRPDPEIDVFGDIMYTVSKSRDRSTHNYNLHLWWANKFHKNLKYGFNYIRKISDRDNVSSNINSRVINRIDVFSETTTLESRLNIRNSDYKNEILVNTFRGGFILGSSPDMVIDLILKVEFSDFKTNALLDRINNWDYLYTRPSYIRQWERSDTTTNVLVSDGNSNVYGLKMNLKNKLDDSIVQNFLFSYDKISFDVSENTIQKYSTVDYQRRDSIFSNSQTFSSSELNSVRINATGYVLGFGMGREITIENAIVGIGINAEITHGSWDENITILSMGITEESNNDTTFQLNLSTDSTETISSDVSTKLIFFPIGSEFTVSKRVSLRMGVEFNALLTESKMSFPSGKILSQLENSSTWITKTFGIGYKHSDKFFVDLIASSDLSRISLWRISIQYGL